MPEAEFAANAMGDDVWVLALTTIDGNEMFYCRAKPTITYRDETLSIHFPHDNSLLIISAGDLKRLDLVRREEPLRPGDV